MVLILGKKKQSQKEEKPEVQATKNRAPSSAQGLDPPLKTMSIIATESM